MLFKEKYEQKNIIGKGAFSIVYKVLDNKSNKFYALKFITNVKNKDDNRKVLDIIKTIKNKYIINFIDNFYDEIKKGYCIVMELCDGNLNDILNKYKPNGLPLIIIKKILIQLNEALQVIIKKGTNFLSLKPENILVKYSDTKKINFDIKLTDLFFSSPFSKNGANNYMAPEIETFRYNNKSNLWNLGVILYELFTNKYIFYSKNPKEMEIKRKKGIITNETNNKMINKLIRKLIQVDVNKRIKWEGYFNDLFFKNNMYKPIKFINLKSPLLKLIFSYLKESKKLEIIMFNKKLQKKLEVNIENYKKYSNRYKIGEINGKGEEYLKSNKKKYLKVNI